MKNILETKNKRGLAPLVIILIVVAIVGIGIIGYSVVKQAQIGEEEAAVAEEKCALDPIITVSALNKHKPGTVVTLSGIKAIVNGEFINVITSGTTKFNYGDEVELLIGAEDYLNATLEPVTMKCGENKVIAKVWNTDKGTLDILDSRYNEVTDGDSDNAVNVTGVAGVVDFVVTLRGTSDDYTGILLVTIEGNNTQVDKFTVTPKSANAVVLNADYPVGDLALMATDEFSGSSIKYGFLVDGLLDGAYAEYLVSMQPESGITIGEGDNNAPFYVNVYSSQAGVEIDGTFHSGLADDPCFEDEDGTIIYEDKWEDHDFAVD